MEVIKVPPPSEMPLMKATPVISAEAMEKVLLNADLSQLQANERLQYYRAVCDSVGLNPLTTPFEFIKLQGKLQLYAKRACTEQLRQIRNVSVKVESREVHEQCYVVTVSASLPNGREDCSIGVVPLTRKFTNQDGVEVTVGLKGEDLANAMMKAETKAKRRVTLAICGLSMMDETEVAAVAAAKHVKVNMETGEITGEGSKADAADVLRMKLAAIDAGVPASAVNSLLPDVPLEDGLKASIEDVKERVGTPEMTPTPAAKKRGRKKAEIHVLAPLDEKKPDLDSFAQLDELGVKSYYTMMSEFALLRERYFIAGFIHTYEAVLKRFGYESINGIPKTLDGLAIGRKLYKDMRDNCVAVEKLRAADDKKKAEAENGGE